MNKAIITMALITIAFVFSLPCFAQSTGMRGYTTSRTMPGSTAQRRAAYGVMAPNSASSQSFGSTYNLGFGPLPVVGTGSVSADITNGYGDGYIGRAPNFGGSPVGGGLGGNYGGAGGGVAVGGSCGGVAVGGSCGGVAVGGSCGGVAVGGSCGGVAVGGSCGGVAVGGSSAGGSCGGASGSWGGSCGGASTGGSCGGASSGASSGGSCGGSCGGSIGYGGTYVR